VADVSNRGRLHYGSIILSVHLVLATCLAAATDSATSTAASLQLTDTQIAAAIAQLGDQDFRVREIATRTLWAAGASVEPALKKAMAENSDPEVVRRASAILSNLAYGITPDMSDNVVALLSRYRTGDIQAKTDAAEGLAEQGTIGARLLLRLRGQERDDNVRLHIDELLIHHARGLAISLISDGDHASAQTLLKLYADSEEENGIFSYAGFLLVHGGLDAEIARVREQLKNPGDGNPADVASRLAILCRAAGDLPSAREAAEKSGDDELLRNVLIEQADWTELARRADADAKDNAPDASELDSLCFSMAFHRLAGDRAGVDRLAEQVRKSVDFPDRRSDAEAFAAAAAEALLLNGRVGQGIDALLAHNQLVTAFTHRAQRLEFAELPQIVERAQSRAAEDRGVIEVKTAQALWFTVDATSAAAALEEAVRRCEKRGDSRGLSTAVGAAHEMGLSDRARWIAVAALNVAGRQPQALIDTSDANVSFVFTQARFKEPQRAAGWWRILRQRFPREPMGKTFETLSAIDQRRMKGEDIAALCNGSWIDALGRVPELRDAQCELIADTLAAFERREPAVARYRELVVIADQSSRHAINALMKLAAMDEQSKNWRSAAERYLQAWSRDRENPVPLYLSGWTLVQSGDVSSGKERMERAHLLPLADQNGRYDLYEALLERKLTEEATRERDYLFRTSSFLSWRRSEALRKAGDEAFAAGDLLAAADWWERAFLDNNGAETHFIEPWANIAMPALVRRARALGLIKARKFEEGIKEAQACLELTPGDSDALIEFVTALDFAGQKAQADALYAKMAGHYAKLCEAYPNGGPVHNLYAWTAAKCRRELESALSHATRAVELQPTNTSSLDTLAETHFQRGEFTKAIVVMSKCVELEPDEPRHKQQIERFRKAAAGK
jgi:tetratricopeptide (TPR) repeat protein